MRNTVTLTIKKAKNLRQKIRGLIGKTKPEAILLQTRFGIHTFGVRFPIDVVILDSKNIVVKLKQNLKPNRIFLWNPRFDRVLELPAGTIQKKKLSLGSMVELREEE